MRQVYKITVDFVNENFCDIDGILHRKDGKSYARKYKDGYYSLSFGGKTYRAHRILWILYNQIEIPEGLVVDHIDRNRSNNSKENLRLVTNIENLLNSDRVDNARMKTKEITRTESISWKRKYNYTATLRINSKYYRKSFDYSEEGYKLAEEWLETFDPNKEKEEGDFRILERYNKTNTHEKNFYVALVKLKDRKSKSKQFPHNKEGYEQAKIWLEKTKIKEIEELRNKQ